MIALSSMDGVLSAMRRARDVSVVAYTLRPGRLEDALVAAARRGAHVRLRLEGQPYKDTAGELQANNAQAIAALRAAGADAREVDVPGSHEAPLHAKAVVADAAVFLDDRNWADDGEETIVRDDFSTDRRAAIDAVNGKGDNANRCFSIRQRDALASEARLLYHARRGDDVIVESESFGAYNRVFRALESAARNGARPRLLVSARDLQGNVRERAALARLAGDGVRVRTTGADEKFALAARRGWIGSANASAALHHPDQLDWGLRTDQRHVIAHLRGVFETRWKNALPLTAETGPARSDR